MEMVTVEIDGQHIRTMHGTTILEAALENKIFIPHLCYHPDLKPLGSCRVCLVELDDGRMVTACRTPVRDGMVIATKSPELDATRRSIIEMIIANHHLDCRHCLKKGRCQLQKIMALFKIDRKKIGERMRLPQSNIPWDESNPFFIRDPNKCVVCGICIETCRDIAGVSAIDFAGRGVLTKVATFTDKPWAESTCTSCGECVIRCPVGALIVRNPQKAATWVKSICPYCGVGCGIRLGITDGRIVDVKGDTASPVNAGRLCVKGRFGLGFVNAAARLKEPLVRNIRNRNRGAKGKGKDRWVPITWDGALDFLERILTSYRGDEVAVIASTRSTNEDDYVIQKFTRVVLKSNNIDTAARLHYGSTIVAMRHTGKCVGFGRRSDSYDFPLVTADNTDRFEQAACILLAGSDVTRSHPILSLKIRKAVENGARLLLINSKETELVRLSEKWLKPAPGTDLALIMGMCSVIVEEAMFDEDFVRTYCRNYDEFRNSLDDFSLGRVERITGVDRELIRETAEMFALNKPAAIFWGPGTTQWSHGTSNVYALINLSILTGNIQYPFSLNPLSEQSNALGACDMGCLPDYYPCYQPVGQTEVQRKFEQLWGVALNPKPGLAFPEIFDAVRVGKVKVLYIIGSNPIATFAPSEKVRSALSKAECVILQDLFLNETAEYASIVLPAASFAEKTGTITNTEGVTQRIEKALEPLGNALPDWEILCRLARKMGAGGFAFRSSEDILSEILSITHSIPETIGKFTLFPLSYIPPAEATNVDYPLMLTRRREVYEGGVLAAQVEGLKKLSSKNCLIMNPKDASDFGLEDGHRIRIESRYGAFESTAALSEETPIGLVVYRGDPKLFHSLLNPALDPVSKTPEMHMCAVRIEKIEKMKTRRRRTVETFRP